MRVDKTCANCISATHEFKACLHFYGIVQSELNIMNYEE